MPPRGGTKLWISSEKHDHADRVALPQGHVAEHEHGVQGVVQQAQAGRLVGHHPAAVDQEDDPLALAGLKVLDGELLPPGGGPPVDVLVVVVERVVAEPLELVVLADPPRAAHAQQAQAVGPGQQGVLRRAASCRDRRGRSSRPDSRAAAARAPAGCGAQSGPRRVVNAPRRPGRST